MNYYTETRLAYGWIMAALVAPHLQVVDLRPMPDRKH